MHFFNPVPVMTLVEVVRGLATSDAAFATVHALAVKLGKTPVEVNDAPGFVSNRVLMPLINEAAFAVMEGVATPEAVDQVFKLGMAHPMGPLTLADFIGLDVCVDILRVLAGRLRRPEIPPLPAAGAHGGCRLAGTQIGARVLSLRRIKSKSVVLERFQDRYTLSGLLRGCRYSTPRTKTCPRGPRSCWSRQLGFCGFEVQQSWNRYSLSRQPRLPYRA